LLPSGELGPTELQGMDPDLMVMADLVDCQRGSIEVTRTG